MLYTTSAAVAAVAAAAALAAYTQSFLYQKIGPLFLFFAFSIQLTVSTYYCINNLPMTGFEPWTSEIGSDRNAN